MDQTNILVVDDNHINRLFFQSALRKMQHQCSTAESGPQAIELCNEERFDLILMDIRMQGMNGIEAARAIKQLPGYQDTPILAISAETFAVDDYPEFTAAMLKPVKPERMQQLIRQHLPDVPWFDDQLAMDISHQDADIVHKLRDMLKQDLPVQSTAIHALFAEHKKSELQDVLHQLLGSARVCAASRLIQATEALKLSLDQQQHWEQSQAALDRLTEVMSGTIKQVGQT
jgi:two-component system sensor histidine kinase BarA